ncbi:hypothetical protein D3C85_1019930 [compost metagenome]
MAMPIVPMAAPRLSGGKTVRNTFITRGMMMPAPPAWMIRPISMMEKVGATAHMTEPAPNMAIAQMNNDRVPNDSIRKAVIGIRTPLTSI